MSILIQAGHRSSYSDIVMQRLYERGLDQPSNSFTYNMTAQQVTDKLYQIVSRTGISVASNKLADNMMVDLLLSNLDTQSWGWSAEKNLFAMDLWQQVESDARFILVFDHPTYLLNQLIDETMTVDTVDQAVSEWLDYHRKMLEVLERHEDIAILIEGGCAADNISNLGKRVESIASDLHLKKHWQVFKNATNSTFSNDTDAFNQSSAAVDYMNSEIIKKYPEVIKLFNTLLNKATIKNSEPIYRTKKADLIDLVIILNDLYDQQNNTHYLVEKELLIKQVDYTKKQLKEQTLVCEEYEKQSKQESEILKKQLKEAVLAQQEIEVLLTEKQKNLEQEKNKIKELELKAVDSYAIKKNIDKDILLTEIINTENKDFLDFSKKVERKKNKSQSLNFNKKNFGASVRFKNSKEYVVGRKLIDIFNNPKKIFKLKEVYSEANKIIYSEVVRSKSLPDLRDYEDFHEVEKIKNHLSYKIGNEIFSTRNYKVFVLPVVLIKHALTHRKETEGKL